MSFVLPRAAWSASLDGTDLTATLAPRLVSLTLTEKRGGEADELEIVLHDADGRLAIPSAGAVLAVRLGWERGSGLPLGLIDKGKFKVDEARFSGPPDLITIRARSADLTDAFRIRRERAFVGKTVSHIIGAIAVDNGLRPSVAADLGGKVIPALGTGARSDAALLKALGKRFDAVATVKAGTLIFAPAGKGETAKGTALPRETLTRGRAGEPGQIVSIDYERAERVAHDGAEAIWHDSATGERKTVQAGHKGKGKARRIRKVHATEADAKAAAESAASKQDRAKFKCTVELAYGRPDITPERPIRLEQVKDEIAGKSWIVAEASHTMDGSGGLKSRLQMEAAG